MVDIVEQTLDVELQDPIVPPASLACYSNGVQCRPSGSVAIRVRQENGLHSRIKGHLNYHLCHSIPYCWDPKDALTSILLWYGNRFHRRGKVAPRRHPVPDLIKIILQILLKILNRLPVYPWSCTITTIYR